MKNLGGAIRLVFIAKGMNSHGWVERKSLKAECDTLGIGKRYYDWLRDAMEAGFFTYRYSNGKHILLVASYKELYKELGIEFVDDYTATMPVKFLLGKDWIALVWAASNKVNFQNEVISQEKRQQLTSVPVATQRRWNKRAGIKSKRNIAVSTYDATSNKIRYLREFANRKGVFAMGGKCAWHTPSQRVTTQRSIVASGSKRTMRKLGTVVSGAVSKNPRVFCYDKKQVKSALKRREKCDLRSDGIYTILNNGVWLFEAVL